MNPVELPKTKMSKGTRGNHKNYSITALVVSMAFRVVFMMGYGSDEREPSSRFMKESTFIEDLPKLQGL